MTLNTEQSRTNSVNGPLLSSNGWFPSCTQDEYIKTLIALQRFAPIIYRIPLLFEPAISIFLDFFDRFSCLRIDWCI